MKLRSLSARLLLASVLTLPLFLGLMGFGLDRAFRDALQAAELEQLKLQSYLLLGAAELSDDRLVMPDVLSEPRYGQLGSGLYARIEATGGASWISPSAAILRLPAAETGLAGGEAAFDRTQIGDTPVFRYRYGFTWEAPDGRELPFQLVVWQDQAPVLAQVASYRASLARWLVLATLVLIAIQLIVLRFGMRPLRTLAVDLAHVEQGRVSRLTGDYPAEIRGVTDNLNHLLASEQGRRERYRNTLSDLAHSLKTPLAVLRAAVETDAPAEALRRQCEEQLDRMQEIVAHQLGRAASRGARPIGANAIAITPVAERLVAALEKVYRGRSIRFELAVPEGLSFRGDEGDLMEMLGNLLDNACKYGRAHVKLTAWSDREHLQLCIDDDGPGIPEASQAEILQRGTRADRSAPGHGIGLAVAREIAEGYGGALHVEASPEGGARLRLQLPT